MNNNHASMPLVSTTWKILSDILLSRLTPYVDEIIGRINVDSDLISQLLIGYSTLVRYWWRKIANYVLCKSKQAFSRLTVICNYARTSRDTRHFPLRLSKCMNFAAPIFTKLKHDEQNYAKIFYIEFHSNRAVNLESTDRNSCTLLRKVWPSLNRF